MQLACLRPPAPQTALKLTVGDGVATCLAAGWRTPRVEDGKFWDRYVVTSRVEQLL
jgi:hypothetical protein